MPLHPHFVSDEQLNMFSEYSGAGSCIVKCSFSWSADELRAVGMNVADSKSTIMVIDAQGWTYDDDHGKWGLRAMQENASIRILLENVSPADDVDINLHYMTSYTDLWGSANITIYPVVANESVAVFQSSAASLAGSTPIVQNKMRTMHQAGAVVQAIVDLHDVVQESVYASITLRSSRTDPVVPFSPAGADDVVMGYKRYFMLKVELLTGSAFKLSHISICTHD